MSNKQQKLEFDSLPQSAKESLFKEINGTRIVPPNLSGHEKSNLMGTAKKMGFFERFFPSKPKPTNTKLKNFNEL